MAALASARERRLPPSVAAAFSELSTRLRRSPSLGSGCVLGWEEVEAAVGDVQAFDAVARICQIKPAPRTRVHRGSFSHSRSRSRSRSRSSRSSSSYSDTSSRSRGLSGSRRRRPRGRRRSRSTRSATMS